jgi:hypothetical protein
MEKLAIGRIISLIRPWTLREAPQKATNWNGIKNGKSSKKIKVSRYQSIDKKHFWVYGKFEVGLSIPFTRKMSSKKVRLFPMSVFSSNGGLWKLKNLDHYSDLMIRLFPSIKTGGCVPWVQKKVFASIQAAVGIIRSPMLPIILRSRHT